MINEDLIRQIVEKVVCEQTQSVDACTKDCSALEIPVEVSARHVHLSQEDVEALFGKGHTLTKKKDISQQGQFACEERVTIIGPKGELKNVSILGPTRKQTQVEVSLTDSRALGVNAPISMSGDLSQAADIYIMNGNSIIKASKSLIAAQNHVHMTLSDAERFGVKDGQIVRVSVRTKRPMTFDNVVVRANNNSKLAMHIDTDEANACCCEPNTVGKIATATKSDLKQGTPCNTTPGTEEKACVTALNSVFEVCADKKFISEKDASQILKKNVTKVIVQKSTIISSLAKDLFNVHQIEMEYVKEKGAQNGYM
jgi:putative phosphotransacetylase